MVHLIVAVDLSKRSQKALKAAQDLAKLMKRARITVIFVIEYNVPTPLYGHYEFLLPDRNEVEKQLKKFVKGARVGTEVVTAPTASRGILQTAKRLKASHIVISSHGHGALGALVLGSTTQKVIAMSSIPVIVVKS